VGFAKFSSVKNSSIHLSIVKTSGRSTPTNKKKYKKNIIFQPFSLPAKLETKIKRIRITKNCIKMAFKSPHFRFTDRAPGWIPRILIILPNWISGSCQAYGNLLHKYKTPQAGCPIMSDYHSS
jgi:hypothetical protein